MWKWLSNLVKSPAPAAVVAAPAPSFPVKKPRKPRTVAPKPAAKKKTAPKKPAKKVAATKRSK